MMKKLHEVFSARHLALMCEAALTYTAKSKPSCHAFVHKHPTLPLVTTATLCFLAQNQLSV